MTKTVRIKVDVDLELSDIVEKPDIQIKSPAKGRVMKDSTMYRIEIIVKNENSPAVPYVINRAIGDLIMINEGDSDVFTGVEDDGDADKADSKTGMCRGICKQFRAEKPTKGGRYAAGQVRCQICGIYMNQNAMVEGRRCRCCNFKVRTKPRNIIDKHKYRKNTGTGRQIE
ncbi:MAG: hypothetical protein MPI93_02185 [Nitrosopumilus sp.]|nr:hypothetical protein [Nitrosopumilus sp.]